MLNNACTATFPPGLPHSRTSLRYINDLRQFVCLSQSYSEITVKLILLHVSVHVCVCVQALSDSLTNLYSASSAFSLWTPGEVAAVGHSRTGALQEPHPQLYTRLHGGRGRLRHHKSVAPANRARLWRLWLWKWDGNKTNLNFGLFPLECESISSTCSAVTRPHNEPELQDVERSCFHQSNHPSILSRPHWGHCCTLTPVPAAQIRAAANTLLF